MTQRAPGLSDTEGYKIFPMSLRVVQTGSKSWQAAEPSPGQDTLITHSPVRKTAIRRDPPPDSIRVPSTVNGVGQCMCPRTEGTPESQEGSHRIAQANFPLPGGLAFVMPNSSTVERLSNCICFLLSFELATCQCYGGICFNSKDYLEDMF